MNCVLTGSRRFSIGVLAIALALVAAGCGERNNLAATPQGQALAKTNQIVGQSGGDWNKLSDSDRQYLVNGPGHGSEQQARQFLAAEAARSQAGPSVLGGPPKSTPNGHAPSGGPAQGGPAASGQRP